MEDYFRGRYPKNLMVSRVRPAVSPPSHHTTVIARQELLLLPSPARILQETLSIAVVVGYRQRFSLAVGLLFGGATLPVLGLFHSYLTERPSTNAQVTPARLFHHFDILGISRWRTSLNGNLPVLLHFHRHRVLKAKFQYIHLMTLGLSPHWSIGYTKSIKAHIPQYGVDSMKKITNSSISFHHSVHESAQL